MPRVVSLRIAGQNLADGATVTASSSVPTLPPDRVQAEDLADVWRAASTTAWLLADLGATYTIGVVALMATNLIAADAVRVGVSTVDPTGEARDAYDSGTIAAGVDQRWPRLPHFIEPQVSGRYVLIDLAQAAVPDVGRLMIARTWEPSRNFSFGWEPQARDWTTGALSLGLNLIKDLRPKQEGARFILNGITEAEFEGEIREMNRLLGTSKEALVCRNITGTPIGAYTYWGEMEETIRSDQQHRDFFTVEFNIWNRL